MFFARGHVCESGKRKMERIKLDVQDIYTKYCNGYSTYELAEIYNSNASVIQRLITRERNRITKQHQTERHDDGR